MLFTLLNIFYVLIAIAMCVLILLQRGSGAQAGSGFGGGASATVFGARGSATFLSRSTGVLATLFFLISLIMAIYLHPVATRQQSDLGVMSGVDSTQTAKPQPAAPTTAPANTDVPAAPATTNTKPAPAAAMPTPAANQTAGSDNKKPEEHPKKN